MDILHPFEWREDRSVEEKKTRELARLEERFQRDMAEMYRQARIRCRHDSPLFARMVNKRGGVAAARRIVNTCKPSDEFMLLREGDCLSYTVEALVLKEEFRPLFSETLRRRAAARLREYGFPPEPGLH